MMLGFGGSKKNDKKAGGTFGLPGLSFGKAKQSIGQGLGQATNTLKNTGEKVEDFLFGHSKKQKNTNEPSTGSSKIGLGLGLPGLSLDKSEKTIAQGIGGASNTVKETGEKVENLLFGHTSGQKNKTGSSKNVDLNLGGSLSLPDLNLGKTQGETNNALIKTGKKVDDFLFGHSTKPKDDNEAVGGLDANLGFGLPDISLGKTEGKVNQGLGQASNAIRGTGEKVEGFLFGKPDNHSINGFEVEHKSKIGGGLGLPGLSFGKAEEKLNKGLGDASNTIEKSGKKAEDFLFGKPKTNGSNAGTGVELDAKTGVTFGLPNISLSGMNVNNQGLGLEGKNLQNAREKVGGFSIGNLNEKGSSKQNATVKDALGLPSISFGGAGEAVRQGLGQAGNTLKKTGEKVEDFLFGHSGNQTAKNKPSISLPGVDGASFNETGHGANLGDGFSSPDISLGKTGGKVNEGLEQASNAINKTGKKVEDFLFGKPNNHSVNGFEVEHNSKTGSGFGLPELSFGKAGEKIDQGLGKAKNTIEETGKKVEDFLYGKPKNNSINAGTGIELDAKPGVTFSSPNISLSGMKENNQGLGLGGKNLQNALDKVGGVSIGTLNEKDSSKQNATSKDALGLPSISFGGAGEAVRQGLGQAGNTLKKTGEKVEDFLFGHSSNQTAKNKLSISLPGVDGATSNETGHGANLGVGFGSPDISLGKTGGKVNEGLEQTSNAINKTGKKEHSSKIGGGFGLPDLSFVKAGEKIDQGLGQAKNTIEETGKKVEDILFGKPKNNSINAGTGIEIPPGAGGASFNETGQKISVPEGNETLDVNGFPNETLIGIPLPQLNTGGLDSLGNVNEDGGITENNEMGVVNQTVGNNETSPPEDSQNHQKTEYTTLVPTVEMNSVQETTAVSSEPNTKIFTFEDVFNSSENMESHTSSGIAAYTGSPINSLEDSAIGLFGASETPSNLSTKSEETLQKIEDILKGSGTATTLVSSVSERTKIKDLTPIENPSSTPQFTYTNEVLEESSKLKPKQSFNISIAEEESNIKTPKLNASGPAILPPYFVVPNNNGTIGEQDLPLLPPTVFDKPTGDRAPFIPILPAMESSTGNPPPLLMTPSTPTYRSLTPAEYGAIGIGSVLIFALIAFIYQKYKQISSGSSGGSYSPKNHDRKASRRRSKSNSSEEGPSPETNGVYRSTTTPTEPEPSTSEVVVVEIETEVSAMKEVEETPVTKTVVNSLQKSSTPEDSDKLSRPENCDNFEVISETQKAAPIEKPLRKPRTSSGSPERFTSDKTSASNLNKGSLKTVSHAIGGILRGQAPKRVENKNTEPKGIGDGMNENKTVSSDSTEKILNKPLDNPNEPKKEKVNQVKAENDKPETVLTDSEPLYKSVEGEADAGSEYFSADENNDVKNTPPPSPSTKENNIAFPGENLRAADVYNTEIVTEDGRRRSIEEDIAESLKSLKSSDNFPAPAASSHRTDEAEKENFKPSAPLLTPEETSAGIPSKEQSILRKDDINYLPEDIVLRNLINADKNNQQYIKQDAEDVVDDILRTSQLGALTIQSIRKDLGTPAIEKSKVSWSGDTQIQNDAELIIDHKTNINVEKIENLIKSANQNTEQEKPADIIGEVVTEDLPSSNFKNLLINEQPIVGNENCMDSNGDQLKAEDEDKIIENEAAVINTSQDTPIKDDALPKYGESSAQDSDTSGQRNSSTCMAEDFIDMSHVEHKFEFIPPRQTHLLEDDLIVFSHSDQESTTPLTDSTELGLPNEEGSTNNHSERAVNSGPFPMNFATSRVDEELPVGVAKGLTNWENNSNTDDGEPRTKWYIPDDELSEPGIKTGAEQSGGSLYIVLSEESPKLSPEKYVEEETKPCDAISSNENSSRNTKRKVRNSSNISYAFIEIHDDPMLETWPEHLPKNIHSISGVGLTRATNGPPPRNILREEDPQVLPSSSGLQNNADQYQAEISTENPDKAKHKPIPEFILPNMVSRLTKKRMSRRRQIKSLDSGVHHYYGEYLSLAEVPEIDIENTGKSEDSKKDDTASIQEVLTIKSDGTIIQENIVIE